MRNESFYSVFDSEAGGEFNLCSGRLQLGDLVPDRIQDPQGKNAKRACIRCADLSLFSETPT